MKASLVSGHELTMAPDIVKQFKLAADCGNTKDSVSLHRFPYDPKYRRIWTTKVKLTTRRDRRNTHRYVVHTSSRHAFERGLHSPFGMAYKAMLLPDAIQTIFPLSKKVGKAPTKTRGAFFKARKTQGNGHLVILACITQSTSV